VNAVNVIDTATAPAVTARGLGKTYRVYDSPWHRLLEGLIRRPRHRDFVALEGVSFDLPAGEGLGVVGQNGAGKSTLLKMLAGIVAPTHGSLRVRGKVASILELGSGFHPEFSGRQNIVLNAAMLGLTEDEVREKTPEIIAFSELGDFIDQPVKTYSTGMSMRLGFAIATQVDPDVLIIDEALSVGDGYFQKKCMDRIQRFLADGGTLLFCSHAMYYVSAFCRQALWLRKGRAEALGTTADVVRDYENFLVRKGESAEVLPPAAPGERLGPARIVAAELQGGREAPGGLRAYAYGEPWSLVVEWVSEREDLGFHLGVGIDRSDQVQALVFASHQDGREPFTGRRRYRVRLRMPEQPLNRGEFSVHVFLLDEAGLHIYDESLELRAFHIDSPTFILGLTRAPHAWELVEDGVEQAGQLAASARAASE
jgi:ABC-type polysaccharide/polyol phosphate transport system ATPase subunit